MLKRKACQGEGTPIGRGWGVPLGAEAVGGILSQPKEVVVEAPSRENRYRDHEIVCFKNLPVEGNRKPSKDSATRYVLPSILPPQSLT